MTATYRILNLSGEFRIECEGRIYGEDMLCEELLLIPSSGRGFQNTNGSKQGGRFRNTKHFFPHCGARGLRPSLFFAF